MRSSFLVVTIFLTAASCAQNDSEKPTTNRPDTLAVEPELTAVEAHYLSHANPSASSRSVGTVENGALENGHLFPFSGTNWHYFDTNSYLANRCFVHALVLKSVLATYGALEKSAAGREFGLMECSNKHGGKMAPHRTHQNGLSVDFMTPLLKNGQPFTELDYMGASHYLLEFDANGRYTENPEVTIDFELMAQHLLTLQEEAAKNGLSIRKIIWKMELQDELFATESGKKLQQTGVYVTKNLTPLINSLHDDHYHVDFSIAANR